MKIIFTGNFFRFFEDRHICVDILREIITPNISKIPGIQSEYMYPNRCNINNYKNLAERFAETEDMIINWQNYQEESAGLPENIFDDIYVDVDCVVGFEIPPSMCSLLSKKTKNISIFLFIQ